MLREYINYFVTAIIAAFAASVAGCVSVHKKQENAALNNPVFEKVESFDGVSLSAECWNCNEPKTLVFIHGWSLSKAVWRKQIEIFSADYRVIAYDLRGHGESDRPADVNTFSGRWTHARDIEAILERYHVESCAIVVGWSFGAIVAADAAVHLGPDRICGAAFVAGTPDAATKEARSYFGPLLGKTGALRDGPRGAAEEAAIAVFLKESYLHGEWDDALYSVFFDAILSLTPAERRRVVTRPTYSNVDALNETGLPILLIHGEADPVIVSEASSKTAAKLNVASIKLYSETGHWPFLEREKEFNADLSLFAEAIYNHKAPSLELDP